MKCPTCVEQDMTSRVYGGMTETTAMWCPPHWDEDGVRHVHDANTSTTDYRCSNGHSWAEKTTGWCPQVACEWNVRVHGVGSRTEAS